ncbi:hypothetical protein FRX31_017001 [Thalictrum thalictroides]|uniref:Uncharacterized protein n=1 Tax=Thalictrum thalictroides TaxID=46969 RepID=A0A7J6W932_THATH|nr:hypothetical protein FRX31_017001 [Thalictrum thalictroides]
MLELKAHPTEEGSRELTEDDICEKVLGKRSNYTRGLGNGYISSSSSNYNQHDTEEYRRRAETAERRNEELIVQMQDQGNRLQV